MKDRGHSDDLRVNERPVSKMPFIIAGAILATVFLVGFCCFGMMIIGALSPRRLQDQQQDNFAFQPAPIQQQPPAPPPDPNPRAEWRIGSPQIVAEFGGNEIAADAKFKGKIIELVGTVDVVGSDIFGSTYVTLKSNGFSQSQCYFRDKNEVINLRPGHQVTIFGRCDGKAINIVFSNCKMKR